MRRSRIGSKPGGKRANEQLEGPYLDWALADFSGYIAADELYDGPFCVLSIVDNRTFKRLLCQVLDHTPSHDDIRAFFRRFQAHLTARKLTLRGITTDASPLYPLPITEIFGPLPHQICEFHLLKDLNQAILRVVARVRKDLAARKPKLPRGRPTKANRAVYRQSQQLEQKISDLFEQRYLFVQHHLTASEAATLRRITAGFPHLRILRQLMDEAYRLFDRRCRTETALAKLAALRQRVQRFTQIRQILQMLFSVNVEKALTFLDDHLFPATSNAVERGNRRYRQMQKTIYRSRGYAQIVSRLALDMFRDAFGFARAITLQLLHQARAAPSPT